MVLITSGSAESIPAKPWPAERVEFWSIERLIPYGANARLIAVIEKIWMYRTAVRCVVFDVGLAIQ